MWLILAFLSALLLGFYDVAKKQALRDNSVPAVLLLNTFFSSLIFLPSIVSTLSGGGWFDVTAYRIPLGTLHDHILVALKAVIVLSSWAFGYYGIKHLPITIVGPINATRPVMVLIGALLIFGERLNALQWIGVGLAVFSLFMLSRAGRREGIDFGHNVWIVCVAAAALLGAASGLYDRYLMQRLEPIFVQGWYNLY
ncbi:MAG: EamA family transporter, partial [Alistipes sp. 58_9_plus]